MTKIYLSSTYSDLKEYREAVYHTLRQMSYNVIAMEDYVATDMRPLEKCLQDVVACDLYVGLFAWRYGHVPTGGNPEHKSITELEYRKATRSGKSCLIFLLDEDAPWPRKLMDEVSGDGKRGECIASLRHELAKEKTVSYFQTTENLASLVGPAVHRWEEERRPTEWREVLKPVLGVLLVAREPLTLWQIRNILQLEDDRLRDGMAQLGRLIADSEQAGQRRYSLFHLKLQDFLRQDEDQPQKEYIFATDEEQHWHATFAAWCEQGNLALIWKDTKDTGEQSRREYARRHYVTHLYAARMWQQLFVILNEGT